MLLFSSSLFPANIEVETLSVKLASEPIESVNGSTVLMPANRTGVDEDSVIRLSCTVFNQGRFTWRWTLPDSVSSSPPLILDATRTSVIEVPQSSSSVGEYSCSVNYQSDSRVSARENFIIEVECKCRSIHKCFSVYNCSFT